MAGVRRVYIDQPRFKCRVLHRNPPEARIEREERERQEQEEKQEQRFGDTGKQMETEQI